MNRGQQEYYKRDYAQAKLEGKPFFPYAIYKDLLIATLAIGLVIAMAIWHRVEAACFEQGLTRRVVPRGHERCDDSPSTRAVNVASHGDHVTRNGSHQEQHANGGWRRPQR